MAGVLFLVLAVLKMGWISRFLSKAVITGFLLGAAIEVVVGELPKRRARRLDFEAVNSIDSPGVGELDRLAGVDGDLGVTVHFARMKPDARAVLAARHTR